MGLNLDFFEKKQKNLSYIEPFNLENEKELFNMVFGLNTTKKITKTKKNLKSKSKSKPKDKTSKLK